MKRGVKGGRQCGRDKLLIILIKRNGYITIPLFLLSFLFIIISFAKYNKSNYEENKRNIKKKNLKGNFDKKYMYDAIIIPGGGLTKDGRPHSFVQARLKKAWNSRHEAKYFITLSRGTTLLPPKLDQNGYEIDECKASAQYLYSLGDIKKDRILLECWSFDTIGNAVATRLMHTDIADLKRLLIITNKFHIERTKSIFTHIFNLPSGKIINTKKNDNNNGFFFFFSAPSSVSQSSMHPTTSKYKLAFMEVNNDGMSSKQIEQRIKKEKTSLEHFNKLKELKLKTMDDLHKFIMLSHKAYSFQTDEEIIQRRKNDLKSTQAVLDTY